MWIWCGYVVTSYFNRVHNVIDYYTIVQKTGTGTGVKSHPNGSRFSNALNRLALWSHSNCKCLIPMSTYDPLNRPPVGGIKVGLGGSKMIPIKISSLHSYSSSIHIHTIGLSCTVWPQYTTRQTDRRQTTGRQTERSERVAYAIASAAPKLFSCSVTWLTLILHNYCYWLNVTLHWLQHLVAISPPICGTSKTPRH